jgi:hypothetical protein
MFTYDLLVRWAAGPPLASPATAQSSAVPSNVVSNYDLLPPGYARHCAAVAVWGANLSSLMALVNTAMQMLYTPAMLGSAPCLLSWEQGGLGLAWVLYDFFVLGIHSIS